EGMPTKIYNVGEPINSKSDDFGFIIKPDEQRGYFSSNRDSKTGLNDDIYFFKVICHNELSGILYDEKTGEPLAGLVELYDKQNNLIDSVHTKKDGENYFEVDVDSK